SFADLGLSESMRHRGDAHSQHKQDRAAPVYICGTHCEREIKLRGSLTGCRDVSSSIRDVRRTPVPARFAFAFHHAFCQPLEPAKITPAVTAIALTEFASVLMSTSAWIGHTPKEQANATGHVLNCIDEWAIDFDFDRRRGRRPKSGACHHCHSSCSSCFSSLFIHGDESLVEDLRNIEVVIRLARRHLVEIRAALRLIERGFHSQRFKFFGQSNCWRLKLELWQMKIDVAPFEFGATGECVAA